MMMCPRGMRKAGHHSMLRRQPSRFMHNLGLHRRHPSCPQNKDNRLREAWGLGGGTPPARGDGAAFPPSQYTRAIAGPSRPEPAPEASKCGGGLCAVGSRLFALERAAIRWTMELWTWRENCPPPPPAPLIVGLEAGRGPAHVPVPLSSTGAVHARAPIPASGPPC
jgi:hypothetical protein